MQKNAIKDGGSTAMHSKSKGGKKDGLDLKTFFFFGFRQFLENFQEIVNSREFSRNFTSRSRSRGIFISLFTSRKEWIRFSFHFSLLKNSETDFHFTFHFKYPLSQVVATLYSAQGHLWQNLTLFVQQTQQLNHVVFREVGFQHYQINVVQFCAVWPKQISLLSSECTSSDLFLYLPTLTISQCSPRLKAIRKRDWSLPIYIYLMYAMLLLLNRKSPKIASSSGFLNSDKDSRTKVVLARKLGKQGLGSTPGQRQRQND